MAQVQCPKCGSFKTMSDRMIVVTLGIGLIVIGAFLGVFVFPLVFMPIGLVLIIIAAVQKPKKWTCNACKYKFPTSEIKK